MSAAPNPMPPDGSDASTVHRRLFSALDQSDPQLARGVLNPGRVSLHVLDLDDRPQCLTSPAAFPEWIATCGGGTTVIAKCRVIVESSEVLVAELCVRRQRPDDSPGDWRSYCVTSVLALPLTADQATPATEMKLLHLHMSRRLGG